MTIDEFARGITERIMEKHPEIRAEYRHTIGDAVNITLRSNGVRLNRKITKGAFLGCTIGTQGPNWVRQLAAEYARDLANPQRSEPDEPEDQLQGSLF